MQELEWEQGLIHIPRTEWTNFKRRILNTYNHLMESDFSIALDVYNLIQKNSKNKRNYNFRREAVIRITQSNLTWDSVQRIEEALFHGEKYTSRKIYKPKKKDFPLITNKTKKINLGVAQIALNNKNKTIRWIVPENPHATIQAKEHIVSNAIFNLLDNISWSKNTGGIIVGNNKNNLTKSNYVSYSYGPLGKKINTQQVEIPSLFARY